MSNDPKKDDRDFPCDDPSCDGEMEYVGTDGPGIEKYQCTECDATLTFP